VEDGKTLLGDHSFPADSVPHNKIRESADVIVEALKLFRGPEIALSFNGGKDCTVIFHVLRAVCAFMDTISPVQGG